jgi:DNA repair exonuclease SbcCD ATPase subunit
MNRLANGNPAQQADIFYEVERDYTSAPTTASTLRYGAALVTAGHPAANLVEGKKLLERLLANAERLTPAEKSLAAFLVKDADARLQLQAEVRRLAATVDERARGQANLGTRLQSQVQAQGEEIARLRKQLEDAQQKLDAIKSMEKSFIERGSSPPPPSRP